MSDAEPKPTRLVVLPAFEPCEMRDKGKAIRTVKEMARRHVGVIVWSRPADLLLGAFGLPAGAVSAGRCARSGLGSGFVPSVRIGADAVIWDE